MRKYGSITYVLLSPAAVSPSGYGYRELFVPDPKDPTRYAVWIVKQPNGKPLTIFASTRGKDDPDAFVRSVIESIKTA
jgi:hypothetical protein